MKALTCLILILPVLFFSSCESVSEPYIVWNMKDIIGLAIFGFIVFIIFIILVMSWLKDQWHKLTYWLKNLNKSKKPTE